MTISRLISRMHSFLRPGLLSQRWSNVFLGRSQRHLQRDQQWRERGAWVETLEDRTLLTLTAGDVAIIGFQADSPEDFSWVPLVDLSASEEIFFSNAGYRTALDPDQFNAN